MSSSNINTTFVDNNQQQINNNNNNNSNNVTTTTNNIISDNNKNLYDENDDHTYNLSEKSSSSSNKSTYNKLFLNQSMFSFDYVAVIDFTYTPSNIYSFQYTIISVSSHETIETQHILISKNVNDPFFDKISQINQMPWLDLMNTQLCKSINKLPTNRVLILSPQSINLLLLDLPQTVRILDFQAVAQSRQIPIQSFSLFRRYFIERQLILDYNFTIISLFVDIAKYYINGNIKFTTISPKTINIYSEREGKLTFFKDYIFTTIPTQNVIKSLILDYRTQLKNQIASSSSSSTLSPTTPTPTFNEMDKKNRITFLRKLKQTLQKRQIIINTVSSTSTDNSTTDNNNNNNNINNINNNIPELNVEKEQNQIEIEQVKIANIDSSNNLDTNFIIENNSSKEPTDKLANTSNSGSNEITDSLKSQQFELVRQLNRFIKSEQKSHKQQKISNSTTIIPNNDSSSNETNRDRIDQVYDHILQQNDFNKNVINQVQSILDKTILNQQFFLNEIKGLNKKIDTLQSQFYQFKISTTPTTSPTATDNYNTTNNTTIPTIDQLLSPMSNPFFEIHEKQKELLGKQHKLFEFKKDIESQLEVQRQLNESEKQQQQQQQQQVVNNNNNNNNIRRKIKPLSSNNFIHISNSSMMNNSLPSSSPASAAPFSFPRQRHPLKRVTKYRSSTGGNFIKNNNHINHHSSLPKNTIMSSFTNFIKSFKK